MRKNNDGYASGDLAAGIAGVFAFGLISLCLGTFFVHSDKLLILTIEESFAGLSVIREIFRNVSSYAVSANPLGVAHVRYAAVPETLEEVEDLERRGLVNQTYVSQFRPRSLSDNPSLLHRLMVTSWCSSGLGPLNGLPAERTPGCQCIARAYLDLVNATRPVNASNTSRVNVSSEVGTRLGDQVYKCWDQRLVRRSRSCGKICKTHVVGLALFGNIVLFLVCAAYLMFYKLPNLNGYVLKFMLVVLGVVLGVPYYVVYAEVTAINVAGIAVCLFYLTVGLHEELSPDAQEDRSDKDLTTANPFTVCLLVNLPLILSAHALQFGASGGGRDIWAMVSFGTCGGLLGLLLQVVRARFFLCVCGCSLTSFCASSAISGHAGTTRATRRATSTRTLRGWRSSWPTGACKSCCSCSLRRTSSTRARTAATTGSCLLCTRSYCYVCPSWSVETARI
jgi:hypothetical protein